MAESSPSLLDELKRRKVVRAAVIYVAAAFAMLEFADVLFPVLDIPEWGMSLVLGLALVGFPLVLALAWSFDWEAGRVRPERDVEPSPAKSPSGRWIEPRTLVVATVLVLASLGGGWALGSGDGAADVAENGPDTSESGAAATEGGEVAAARLDPRAVAALPFEHWSGLEEDRYFTDGIHDDILTQLHRISDLRVTSRTSVEEYRDQNPNLVEVGRELSVGSILEGSVRRSGDQVRINAQLIDVSAGRENHIWADTYTRTLSATNLFDVQTEIARSVARALAATLTPDDEARLAERPTESTEAYDSYLQGMSFFHAYELSPEDPGWDEATDRFRRAVEADPAFADAWARLGQALGQLSGQGEEGEAAERLAEGRAAAEEALRLEPDNGTAYLALAELAHREDDYEAGLEWGRRGLAVAPERPELVRSVASSLDALSRFHEAAAYWRRATANDPRSGQTAHLSAGNALHRGDLALTAAEFRRVLSLTDAPAAVGIVVGELAPLVHATEGYGAAVALVRRYLEPVVEQGGGALVWRDPGLLRDDGIAERLLASASDSDATGREYWIRGWRARLAGDETSARLAFARVADEWLTTDSDSPEDSVDIALALALAGEDQRAGRILDSEGVRRWLEESGSAFSRQSRLREVAKVRGEVGDVSEAVSLLRQSADLGLSRIHPAYLETLPQWAALRGHPEFNRFLSELRSRL